jgi:hypothetical protein
MNMFAIYLHIWKFERDRNRSEIWTKTACPDMSTFLPNFDKKSQILRLGRDLADI